MILPGTFKLARARLSVRFIHLALLFGSADGRGMLGPDAPHTICLGGGRNLPGITSGQLIRMRWEGLSATLSCIVCKPVDSMLSIISRWFN